MSKQGFFHYSSEQAIDEAARLIFLSEASAEEWQKLMACMEHSSYEDGESVVNEGDSDSSVFFIVSGKLQVSVLGNDKQQRDIIELVAGAIFGEQAFFDCLPRSATVRGVEAGEIMSLDRAHFETLAEEDPVLANKVLLELGRVLSSRLRRATNKLATS